MPRIKHWRTPSGKCQAQNSLCLPPNSPCTSISTKFICCMTMPPILTFRHLFPAVMHPYPPGKMQCQPSIRNRQHISAKPNHQTIIPKTMGNQNPRYHAETHGHPHRAVCSMNGGAMEVHGQKVEFHESSTFCNVKCTNQTMKCQNDAPQRTCS